MAIKRNLLFPLERGSRESPAVEIEIKIKIKDSALTLTLTLTLTLILICPKTAGKEKGTRSRVPSRCCSGRN